MKRRSDSTDKAIDATLDSVLEHTGFAAIYTPLYDDAVRIHPGVNRFCAHCLRDVQTAPLCRYACRHGTMQSLSSGEPYYQRCWAGLFYTTVAIAPANKCRGGLSVGGFYGEGESDDIQAAVHKQIDHRPETERAAFLNRLNSIREITPARLGGIGRFLMETATSSGLNSNAFFERQHKKYKQQRAIAEAFEDIQKEEHPEHDILADTYRLTQILQAENPETAMRFVSDYLARVLAMSRWDLTKLQANARVLLAVMTSRDITHGADWEIATAREAQHMQRIMTSETIEDCSLEIADLVLHRLDRAAPYKSAYGTVAERVRRWMQQHYGEDVELADMARAVGASPSTVVHELKRETGRTSRQLLAEVRVDEAKRLLATTELELSAVAALCGFFDQSHFTRTFKSHVNLTPGRFRALLHFTKQDV